MIANRCVRIGVANCWLDCDRDLNRALRHAIAGADINLDLLVLLNLILLLILNMVLTIYRLTRIQCSPEQLASSTAPIHAFWC